ncbi:hypothetical protein OpiT1DRAFT_01273 [Opitutaceae bacterium TAV1]|nr:hypothetical protein OpiT1DRAFT_01273 [Opitutaceae bacterium TAV1]
MSEETNTERLNAPYYFVFPNLPRDVWYGSPGAPDSALLVGCVWSEGPDSATKLAEALNCQATKDVCWLDWKRRAEAAEALVAELREALEIIASGDSDARRRAEDALAKTPADMGAELERLRSVGKSLRENAEKQGAYVGQVCEESAGLRTRIAELEARAGEVHSNHQQREEWIARLLAQRTALTAAGDALASDIRAIQGVLRCEKIAVCSIGNNSLSAWDAAKKGGAE